MGIHIQCGQVIEKSLKVTHTRNARMFEDLNAEYTDDSINLIIIRRIGKV